MGLVYKLAEKCYYKALDKSASAGRKYIEEKYRNGEMDQREYNHKMLNSYKEYKNYINKYWHGKL